MRVLIVAPHCDDETLGAGGTAARHAAAGDHVTVAVITGPGDEPHPIWPASVWDTVRSEAAEACHVLGVANLLFENVPAALVDREPAWRLNQLTDRIIQRVQPETLYVPFPFDLHKDHREVFHSLAVAYRPNNPVGRAIRSIYAYEVPSETHWTTPYVESGFLPNTWVDITHHLETKLQAMNCYRSQLEPAPQPRSLYAVEHQARWRGSQIGTEAAEAFVLVRQLMPSDDQGN